MENKNKSVEDKIKIVSDIINKLKNHIGKDGNIINLYKPEYSYYSRLKKDFNEYIKNEYSISNKIKFEEINCYLEYTLPIKKIHNSIFIVKKRN